ncbi:MFS transporter [Baekduia soli]|uniref:MFS transporter n=1 Tax=Baekduia soli TaxID=496014 RepID=A0A5B8UCN9_9ACTN|nr:MFS transporter [Baekduia soli]
MTFVVLAVAATAYVLLQSLVLPALPDFQRDLHASETSVSWILTAYLLSASIATPIIGRLGDMYGKERVLLIVLVILAAGTLLSAVATSMNVLIAGRVVQGVGGGMFPLAFGIIRDEFPRQKVAGGIGLMSSLIGIGGGAGVVLAGPIVQSMSYHWLFWFPLVAIVIGAVATHFFVPESPVKTPGQINWMAAVLMSAGLVAVLVAVSETTLWGWGSVKTLGLIAIGLVILAGWVVTEARSREPLVDMRMMRIKGVWTTNAAAFLFGLGMYSAFIIIPQYVQEPTSTGYGFGASVVESGLFLLPSTVAMLLIGQFSGTLDRIIGSRPVLILGAASTVGSFAVLTFARSHEWEIYAASALMGVGIGLAFAALANLIVQNVPQEQTGVATGMNTVMRSLGGALGGQVAATFIANSVTNGSPTDHGFTLAFGVCLAGLVASLLVSFLVPRRGIVGEVDPHRPPVPGDLVGQEV